ncbi:sulfite exporter TauE/SafE family protein [Nonomuraea turkmeniaca]|uniref:Sulfite exporter TauE/SafE family protein n=1 Tax=Nonomuraea turkmeniaca TaxID=103838 RepID=A0A5S4FK33_9ACTN|nr:sulfite exporter TauE/SafE family protein [Nonomuraea turkmeniaca]TMR21097.1 sulfite exporter TauE/SafE family protein [Nonomuraea turkmeniaca]
MSTALTLLAGGLAAGLVAGTATCTAAQGGLLMGLVDRCHGRDPALVGWFLAGRLASYTLAGALLGLLGSAVSLPPEARAALLVAAGVTVIVFAVRVMRRGHCAAPHDGQVSRYKAPLLGAATILLPCGVTLSMEMIAVSSGSPLAGAAAMAGFVVGTAPAFALLGYVLRRVSRTRLAKLAGVVAIAAGLWTAGAGLSLGGWLPETAPPAAAGPLSPTVTVWATPDGYRPAMVPAPAGVPVEIVFKRADRGCTGTVVIGGRDVVLPATVRLPPQPPGTLRYVCGMGMYAGFINFS